VTGKTAVGPVWETSISGQWGGARSETGKKTYFAKREGRRG